MVWEWGVGEFSLKFSELLFQNHVIKDIRAKSAHSTRIMKNVMICIQIAPSRKNIWFGVATYITFTVKILQEKKCLSISVSCTYIYII